MAPKTATKRGRPEKSVPSPKRRIAKAPKVDPRFEGIFDAVKRADLPEQCKQMLRAVVPDSLGVAANDRHSAQVVVVGIIESMLTDITAKMTAEVEEQKGLITNADAKKESLAASVADAESRKATAAASNDEKKQLVLAADKVVQEKLSLLAIAQSKQAEGDQSVAPVQSEKDQFEAAANTEFEFLLESEERPETEAKKQFDRVKPLIDKLNLDESLAIPMFKACEKAPSARSEFETMVVEQLAQHLKDKLAKLDEELAASAPGKAERAEVVRAAQLEVDQAREAQTVAKSESTTTHETLEAVTAELRAAQEAVDVFDMEQKKASEVLDTKIAALQQFQEWNVESFKFLNNTGTVSKDATMEEDAGKVDVLPVEQGGA